MRVRPATPADVPAMADILDASNEPIGWPDVPAPDADPVRAVFAAWRAAAPDGGRVRGVVPGPHPAVAPMLDRGVRILDRDTFCATDPGLLDPVRILPNPGFL